MKIIKLFFTNVVKLIISMCVAGSIIFVFATLISIGFGFHVPKNQAIICSILGLLIFVGLMTFKDYEEGKINK